MASEERRACSCPQPGLQGDTGLCRPLTAIRQVWRDYQNGRTMRKKATLDAAASKCEVPDDECPNDGQRADGLKSNGQWQNQGGEYPWRISKTVQGDVTWRGTWTLEARDRYGLSWERRKIHDGKKWKWENLPVEHWPFDHQGRWVFLTQEQEDEKVPVWKD